MSEDDKGFLARWSQRKRDAVQADTKPAAPEESAQSAETIETAADEAESPFDLDSLPKLEDLTADTDMTVFFKKGVPESIRNAALRKSWALDPAIRNYVNPALDYAYDWNTPGGVPGSGELAPGTDIARMVSQIMGGGAQHLSPEAVDRREPDETYRRNTSSEDAAEQQDVVPPAPSVRLSGEPSPEREQRADAAGTEQPSVGSGAPKDEAQTESRAFASQQEPRRHGSARPK